MYRGKKLFDLCDDRINKMEMYLTCFLLPHFFRQTLPHLSSSDHPNLISKLPATYYPSSLV